MIIPEYNKFRDLARDHGRVVVYREISGDLVTPVALLNNNAGAGNLFLLESANLDKSFSRYTFFGLNPEEIITFKNGTLTLEKSNGDKNIIDQNPIEYMTQILSKETSHRQEALGNFCGGYVGFMGYDMVNYMGVLRREIKEDAEQTIMAYMKVNEFYVFDNHMGKLFAAVSVETKDDLQKAYDKASARSLEMALEIQNFSNSLDISDESFQQIVDFRQDEYTETVNFLKREIENGEGIQVVLSNRYEVKCKINPVNLYRSIRNINPSPYMFYLKFGDDVLLGTSPEVHLKITDGIAVLKPIAGTYRLENGNVESVKEKLLSDPKEKAEHLMLLDLARNDIYTGCDHNTVKVVSSFQAEVYSHLVHIVSEVQGNLSNGVEPMKLFCSTFPAGTVSGAPKVRAMELIDQYEKTPRGFYAGCAGYFSYSQDLDTCIIIRSALVTKESTVIRAGAGIVYDSVPEKEYREVENKLGALFDSLKNIRTLEAKNVFAGR